MSEQPHAAHHDDHGHGEHSPFIQHHFDDAKHMFDAGKLGIWLFLAQEVLFFSALFVAYILFRSHHPEIFAYAHNYLDTKMGAINTAVLIFSSLTAAWAVRAAQLRQTKLLIACLATTIVCAFGFLVIKYFEYTHKIHEQILFGEKFDPCISPSENPLATKSNLCPGTKTTIESRSDVEFFHAKRVVTNGCFPNVAIDTDLATAGVQASCKVYEVKGKDVKGADGKPTFQETARKEVTEQCHDPFTEAIAKLNGKFVSHGPGHGADAKKPTEKFPCWRPAEQPAVCSPGWFYGWTCEGEKCEKPSGAEGPFLSQQQCGEKRSAKKSTVEGQGTATLSECSYGGASAILVNFEDHQVRKGPAMNTEGTRIVAECAAPAGYSHADLTIDKADPLLSVGKKTSADHVMDAHEHHELEKQARYAGPPPANTNMFFTIYFAMTGLHGIHVLIGIFIFIWLLIRSVKGHFTPDYFGPIDFAALYWHIVDLIWIFLFPLMYLIH